MSQLETKALSYRVIIEPLGLLYGSSGRFLSPDNLVGRSGTHFPPSAATLSGIFADTLTKEKRLEDLRLLQLAGPFWGDEKQSLYVPTPFNCLVKDKKIKYYLTWDSQKWQGEDEADKYESGTWFPLTAWEKLQTNPQELSVMSPPWQFLPHLHPRLKEDERHTKKGYLFLENGVQLDQDAYLVYLSNTKIEEGWYRFGGEGHLVNLRCENIDEPLKTLLNQPLGHSFVLITPAVWGSNRLSYRAPEQDKEGNLYWSKIPVTALLTQRPQPTRYRLGKYKQEVKDSTPKILSRGRYAIPAGSVYLLKKPLQENWHQLSDSLFPTEGVSLKRWGCGLALPIASE